jgi:protein-S-isoprenylcysteine O-methyltransferase Ste14
MDGPFAYIRNPFYASYLLAMLSTAVMWPSVFRFALVLAMLVYFTGAAMYEEHKFGRSGVAADYAQYKARTGRFLPALRLRAS